MENRKERINAEGAENAEFAEKGAATPSGVRASILAKAEPRPVEDEVDCPAAAFDC